MWEDSVLDQRDPFSETYCIGAPGKLACGHPKRPKSSFAFGTCHRDPQHVVCFFEVHIIHANAVHACAVLRCTVRRGPLFLRYCHEHQDDSRHYGWLCAFSCICTLVALLGIATLVVIGLYFQVSYLIMSPKTCSLNPLASSPCWGLPSQWHEWMSHFPQCLRSDLLCEMGGANMILYCFSVRPYK